MWQRESLRWKTAPYVRPVADRVRRQSRPSGRRRVSDLASRRIAPQTRPCFRQRASNQASGEQTRPGGREPQTTLGSRQGASHWARRQTGGLRPGPAADRGPQTRPGGKQGASDQARRQTGGLRSGPVADKGVSDRAWWQTGGLRPGPAADRGPHTQPGGRQGASDRARRQRVREGAGQVLV